MVTEGDDKPLLVISQLYVQVRMSVLVRLSSSKATAMRVVLRDAGFTGSASFLGGTCGLENHKFPATEALSSDVR
jgi:hypothetical protein